LLPKIWRSLIKYLHMALEIDIIIYQIKAIYRATIVCIMQEWRKMR